MMIKALFLDVDGTLISFKTHEIPDSARDALLRAHERGVRIFIATGRAASDLEQLKDIPYEGVVALNGSDCRMRDGRVIASYPIPREDFERAMKLSDEYGFSLAFELDEGVFVNRLSPAAIELAELVAHPVPVETDLYEFYDKCECCQMCFYFDAETERRVMPQLPGLVASRWCPIFVDVNVSGVNKATGMQAFMGHYGLTSAEVAAIGDGGNDVEMLLAAGMGVAMGNACDEAMHVADHITCSVDDHGIARALEHMGIFED